MHVIIAHVAYANQVTHDYFCSHCAQCAPYGCDPHYAGFMRVLRINAATKGGGSARISRVVTRRGGVIVNINTWMGSSRGDSDGNRGGNIVQGNAKEGVIEGQDGTMGTLGYSFDESNAKVAQGFQNPHFQGLN